MKTQKHYRNLSFNLGLTLKVEILNLLKYIYKKFDEEAFKLPKKYIIHVYISPVRIISY